MIVWCVEDDASIRDIEVYTLNSTGAVQGYDILVGKFKNNALDSVVKANISSDAAVNMSRKSTERWDQWQAYAYGITDAELSKMNTRIEVGTFQKGDADMVKVFCWNSFNLLKPIGPTSNK